MKNSNDTIRNRTRDLPACSAVPQPTAPLRAPLLTEVTNKVIMTHWQYYVYHYTQTQNENNLSFMWTAMKFAQLLAQGLYPVQNFIQIVCIVLQRRDVKRSLTNFINFLPLLQRNRERNFFIIKPTRCTNFTNLSWHETLHAQDSSSVHHQEFIDCTLSNGICHTGLQTAFEQDQDVPCSSRVSCKNKIEKLVHLFGFIKKKFVTMHGHANVKMRKKCFT